MVCGLNETECSVLAAISLACGAEGNACVSLQTEAGRGVRWQGHRESLRKPDRLVE